MKRRSFLAGVGTLAGAGSFAFGTSAFSFANVERSVSIDVADDDRAFLRLEPLVNDGVKDNPAGRSRDFGQVVSFTIPGTGDGESQSAEGVGLDSVYEFHDLLQVGNQGTQPVALHSSYDGDSLADLALVNDNGVLRNDPPILDVGDSIDVGIYIDTHGSSTGEFDETLTIIADQPDE